MSVIIPRLVTIDSFRHHLYMRQILAVLLLLAAAGFADASPISDKYAQLGGPGGFLGKPTIDEKVAPDGVGHYRHYEHGSIYWHPECGAREVHGLIRQRWAQLGWEKSYLGYPITDEIDLVNGAGRVSRFKGGELIWRSATNQVSEVKSTDLVVDLPFPVGETWIIGQTNAVTPKDSHGGQWAYCFDLNYGGGSSALRSFVATATARIVYVEEGLPSGKTLPSGANNPANVVVQRFGEGRYGSYLHLAKGSYTKEFVKQATLFHPQDLPWNQRPVPATGTKLAETGDTGTDNFHLHYCVTTSPDRPQFAPFESVPVAFRNYSMSANKGATWTYVATGVPHSGQWVRREASKAGQKAGPEVNAAAATIDHGAVNGTVSAGDGKPTGSGTLTVTLLSAWGEPLRSVTIAVTAANLGGPWTYQFNNVPAYPGLKAVASYEGPWSKPKNYVNAEGTPFTVGPNQTAKAPPLALKTTLIK
jgi:LGFP repeat